MGSPFTRLIPISELIGSAATFSPLVGRVEGESSLAGSIEITAPADAATISGSQLVEWTSVDPGATETGVTIYLART